MRSSDYIISSIADLLPPCGLVASGDTITIKKQCLGLSETAIEELRAYRDSAARSELTLKYRIQLTTPLQSDDHGLRMFEFTITRL